MRASELYTMSYRDVSMHKVMLQDIIRTEAYQKALQLAIKPGNRVLDFGCGTGVLSIFAVRSGAKRVCAVDRSVFIQTALKIAKHNRIDNIDFYYDDHESLELSEPVDVIVSEWMGHFLFYEEMLGPLLQVRDRFLAEGGIMIPGEVTLHAGLVCDDSIYEDLSFLHERPYEIDFAPIADVPLRQTELNVFAPDQILESVVDLDTLDLHTLAAPPTTLSGTVIPNKKAKVYALCGWFSTHLGNDVRFGTGPHDPPTHWDQMIFPFSQPFSVSPAKEITVKIDLKQSEDGFEQWWQWSISDGDQELSNNDYEHRDQFELSLTPGLQKEL